MKTLFAILILTTLLTGCSTEWGWYVVDPSNKSGLINLKFLLSGYYYTL
jgi:glutamine transport system permease protein